MVHYSVMIPQRDCGEQLRRQLPRLRAELDGLALPYEILCVDDGSSPATLATIAELLVGEPALRLLAAGRTGRREHGPFRGHCRGARRNFDRHRGRRPLLASSRFRILSPAVAARFGLWPVAARRLAKILPSAWPEFRGGLLLGNRGASSRLPVLGGAARGRGGHSICRAGCGVIFLGWWRGADSAWAICTCGKMPSGRALPIRRPIRWICSRPGGAAAAGATTWPMRCIRPERP